ncbi:uncharacterized protein LOC108631401 [Ceratina calcarata]|uniref:Uncharacterized protein LOC108631401 n=1 Tax=Ceratina calcarata TaxID=156304 RepID=A0AAJ7NE58_9HYME|nr:uncharacterized protein LOC108631401 [Ceratina calcarata]
MDNRRKASSPTATAVGNSWSRDVYSKPSRYSNSSAYHQECVSEHDIKYPGERTSQETLAEIETDINKNNLRNHPDVYAKVCPKHNTVPVRDKYQRFNAYSEYSVPDALTAMQKLQKLKELQMKRDLSERYYSQEIKRLIGEYYFGSRLASPSFRSERLQSPSSHPSSGDRLRNYLESCGTMTTITRLDCGCVQETTRPIFTTARGRVQRRNCNNQSHNETVLKLTPSNPQEHLFSSLEQSKDRYRMKTKKRLSPDPRMCPKIPPGGDHGFETENEKKNQEEPEQEISARLSRSPTPHRKFSDTTATSF